MIWQEFFIRMTDVLAWPLVGLYVALSVRREVLAFLVDRRNSPKSWRRNVENR